MDSRQTEPIINQETQQTVRKKEAKVHEPVLQQPASQIPDLHQAKSTKPDETYMKAAIKEAKKAQALGEVPIGCVIVHQGRIIGRGYNKRITDKNVLSHAELIAIKKACKKMGDWRLEECTMYVTLEPCPMCAGAIVQARIPKVVVGCMNPKAGCAGSVLDLFHEDGFNHQVTARIGIMQQECSQMLTSFFKELRQLKQEKKKQQQKKEA